MYACWPKWTKLQRVFVKANNIQEFIYDEHWSSARRNSGSWMLRAWEVSHEGLAEDSRSGHDVHSVLSFWLSTIWKKKCGISKLFFARKFGMRLYRWPRASDEVAQRHPKKKERREERKEKEGETKEKENKKKCGITTFLFLSFLFLSFSFLFFLFSFLVFFPFLRAKKKG